MAAFVIDHPNLIGTRRTATTTNTAAATTSFPVENGSVFSQNDFGVLNGYGTPQSEILRFSSVAAATLTSSSGSSFGHDEGTTIEVTPYDQIVIEYSTNMSTLWATGAYATIADAVTAATWVTGATINVQPSQAKGTYYDDGSTETRSYRTRFYDSFSDVYSNYSDAVLPTGFEELAVGNIINSAVEKMNVVIGQTDTAEFTFTFMINGINECIRKVKSLFKRWSHDADFNSVSNEITSGQQDYILPTSIDYRANKRSIWNVKGNEGANLKYIDKRQFDLLMEDVVTTTTTVALTTTTTSLTVTDSSDFPDSGTFAVITGSTKNTVTFTANNRSTNTLTITTGVTTTHASGIDIWYNATFGTTINYYTLYEGYIYLHPIPDTGLHLRTLKMDFYKKLTLVNSVNDYIPFNDPVLVLDYLCYLIAIKKKDEYYIQLFKADFDEQLQLLRMNEYSGQHQYFELEVNRDPNDRYYRWSGTRNTAFADDNAPDGA